jgi:hypothetical protein
MTTATTFTESIVEDATLEILHELGYGVVHGQDFARDGAGPPASARQAPAAQVRLPTG